MCALSSPASISRACMHRKTPAFSGRCHEWSTYQYPPLVPGTDGVADAGVAGGGGGGWAVDGGDSGACQRRRCHTRIDSPHRANAGSRPCRGPASAATSPACVGAVDPQHRRGSRSEEHTSELQSLMRISYGVFCLKKKSMTNTTNTT